MSIGDVPIVPDGWHVALEGAAVRSSPVPVLVVAETGELRLASDGLVALLRVEADRIGEQLPRTVLEQLGRLDPAGALPNIVLTRGDRVVITVRPAVLPLDALDRLVILADVTAERGRLADLAYRSEHDEYSRLPNRLMAVEWVGQWLHAGRKVSLVAVELQHFDTLVSLLGDEYAGTLVGVLAKRVEKAAWPDDVVARVGTSTLLVASSAEIDVEDALDLAAMIVDVVGSSVELGGASFPTSAVCGVHVVTAGDDADAAIHDAELAMRVASSRAVDAVLFETTMRDAERRLLVVERALQEAVAEGQLEMYLQPIVSPEDRRVLSYEALSRWFHPELGQVSPAEFIPVAERDGLIRDIGEWTLEQALATIARWRRDDVPCHPIALNLSAAQLLDSSLTTLMLRRVAEERAVGLIVAEVTESMLVSREAHRLLVELAEGGIPLAIDDFGTGFSALSYLAEIPASTLKIDRSFIARLGDERSRTLVEGTIRMGHGLGMNIVAEGVETAEQLDILRSLGCDAIQGFHTGRPRPAIEVPAAAAGDGSRSAV